MSPPSPTPEYAALFNCDAVRDIEEETIAIMFRDTDSRGDVGARAHHLLTTPPSSHFRCPIQPRVVFFTAWFWARSLICYAECPPRVVDSEPARGVGYSCSNLSAEHCS